MEKKLWSNAEIVELGVDSTKAEARNFPDYWACKGCGQQYIFKPKGACEKCGSTDGYKFTCENGDAVTLPNFNGKPTVALS